MAVQFTGTNPYERMEQSLSGRIKPPAVNNTSAASGEQDPNQDLYNQLMGFSQQRLLTDQLAGLQTERETTDQTYSQMYQDLLRSQRMQRGLSDTRGFSGGMAEQFSEKLGAAQIAAMGQVGMGREAAMRDISARERMAPLESALQAAQISQLAQGIDPRRQQLNTLAEIGATGAWADLYNQLYPGSNLKVDAQGNIISGPGTQPPGGGTTVTTPTGTGQVVNPVSGQVINLGVADAATSFTKTPGMLPEEETVERETIVRRNLGQRLSREQQQNFIEYFGENKTDYTNDFGTMQAYFTNQLPFDEWSKIDKEVMGGSGAETEYLLQVGAQPFTQNGEQRIYFDESSNPFLTFLINKYGESGKWGQVPEMIAGTVPGRNYFEISAGQAVKDLEEYLGR